MTTKSSTIVTLTFESKPGKEKEVEKILKSLVPLSLKEKGCEKYELHRSKEDPTTFFMYQIWTDRATLDAHIQTDHIKHATSDFAHLLRTPLKRLIWENV